MMGAHVKETCSATVPLLCKFARHGLDNDHMSAECGPPSQDPEALVVKHFSASGHVWNKELAACRFARRRTDVTAGWNSGNVAFQ